jgi:hypothetical protein
MKYNESEIKDCLLEEDYPNNPQLLESVTRQIQALKGKGEEAFENWFETKEVPDFEIEGISPSFLRKYHSMNDVAILLVYARLLDMPKAASVFKKPVIKHIP